MSDFVGGLFGGGKSPKHQEHETTKTVDPKLKGIENQKAQLARRGTGRADFRQDQDVASSGINIAAPVA